MKAFTVSFSRFSEFDSRSVILLQIKVFGRIIKEIALARYIMKLSVRPSFTRLKVISRIYRVH